jgi:enediyne biosynthesis protein E4
VRVRAADHVYTKFNDGKSGYLSQSSLPLYFGLGDATGVERVEVDWPSGKKQVVTEKLHPNEAIVVVEPR